MIDAEPTPAETRDLAHDLWKSYRLSSLRYFYISPENQGRTIDGLILADCLSIRYEISGMSVTGEFDRVAVLECVIKTLIVREPSIPTTETDSTATSKKTQEQQEEESKLEWMECGKMLVESLVMSIERVFAGQLAADPKFHQFESTASTAPISTQHSHVAEENDRPVTSPKRHHHTEKQDGFRSHSIDDPEPLFSDDEEENEYFGARLATSHRRAQEQAQAHKEKERDEEEWEMYLPSLGHRITSRPQQHDAHGHGHPHAHVHAPPRQPSRPRHQIRAKLILTSLCPKDLLLLELYQYLGFQSAEGMTPMGYYASHHTEVGERMFELHRGMAEWVVEYANGGTQMQGSYVIQHPIQEAGQTNPVPVKADASEWIRSLGVRMDGASARSSTDQGSTVETHHSSYPGSLALSSTDMSMRRRNPFIGRSMAPATISFPDLVNMGKGNKRGMVVAGPQPRSLLEKLQVMNRLKGLVQMGAAVGVVCVGYALICQHFVPQHTQLSGKDGRRGNRE